MKYIDTHCHLNDDQLYPVAEEVMKRASENGCLGFYNATDSLESFDRVLKLAKKYQLCHAVVGIHPEFATRDDDYQKKAFEMAEEHLDEIKAIGEIGLDYHYDKSPKTVERQKEIFRLWLRFAKAHSLPVVIHARDASKDIFDIVKEELPDKADLHCYSGSCELLKAYLKLPIMMKFGVGGVLTFKNARVIKEVVKNSPLNVFMSETDSPYLAPTPYRGKRNEPSYIPLIIEAMASLVNQDKEEVSRILLASAEEFYGTR